MKKLKRSQDCNLVRQLQWSVSQLIERIKLREIFSFLCRPKSRKGLRQYLTLLLLLRVVAATSRAIASLLRTLPKLLEFTEPLFNWKLIEFIKSIFNTVF